MPYKVKIKQFEGPFELLISLIQEHKLKAEAVPVSQIAAEYNEAISAQKALDLEITSDFLIVATILIRLKMNEALDLGDLLDDGSDEDSEQGRLFESGQTTALTLREALLERLLQYKQFSQAAHFLGNQLEAAERCLSRAAALEDRYLKILPDYLERVTLDDIAQKAAEVLARKDIFVLEQQHITAKPVQIELAIKRIEHLLENGKSIDFAELVNDMAQLTQKSGKQDKGNSNQVHTSATIACFLGVLELYRQGHIKLEQQCNFGQISLQRVTRAKEKAHA